MAYSPEQYPANKERIKETQRRYYLKTRETRLAKQREYDAKHRDQIRALKRTPTKAVTIQTEPDEIEPNLNNE
ncbi:hypothetical protein F441_19757 [Phytophthora nicotianae CJ01A1]|uniref:Uncharacterized protein n=6 Tax=Phytophthora nicotianae TaxID=4792 RepID=W2PL64_PHYN3|nr:hypothetical protein PPTG_17735 [Phytophthora nicotianae INRA-310]ETI33432.1 hypothetical protein F443_19889 [Phytophthora nicotianae P1569]ETK73751.1 hypothetical protein L915_19353 [Phytophthora nicotianae]ETO62184.1 hypothetical protein F444_19886 [Phytophthora nicotianae P1976]ETP03263.1 hypothetical protein F441_19757 [Phytophthora nicotianae CJ01A1]ETP31430.1 hypothetical protein F442_19705 [Phytophthora nicotianae P10297]